MKARACPFQLLRGAQKYEAIRQIRVKLQEYIPADVSTDDIGKAMIRLNVAINMQAPTYVFDTQDIARVHQIIVGPMPR